MLSQAETILSVHAVRMGLHLSHLPNGLLFDIEDGGCMFLQDMRKLLRHSAISQNLLLQIITTVIFLISYIYQYIFLCKVKITVCRPTGYAVSFQFYGSNKKCALWYRYNHKCIHRDMVVYSKLQTCWKHRIKSAQSVQRLGCGLDEPCFSSSRGRNMFLCYIIQTRPSQPPVQLISEALSLEFEDDHSPPYSTKIKKVLMAQQKHYYVTEM